MPRLTLAAALLTLVPALAFAHAHLRTALPAPDATVTPAPTQVAIGFTEAVEPTLSSIAVLDPQGAHAETGAAMTAPGDAKQLIVQLKPLQPGRYTVQWRAVAVDTHRTEGTYRFTVMPAAGG